MIVCIEVLPKSVLNAAANLFAPIAGCPKADRGRAVRPFGDKVINDQHLTEARIVLNHFLSIF
jgi:hypothetical protein